MVGHNLPITDLFFKAFFLCFGLAEPQVLAGSNTDWISFELMILEMSVLTMEGLGRV
jgi:hypothetical protein